MKTILKRWWQVVVPVAVVAAFVGLTTTTQTGCGGSSCSNVAGGWTVVEIIKTSSCSGLNPNDTRASTQTFNQNGCDVTFVGAATMTGKMSGSTLTVSGQEPGWYAGGTPIMRNITASTFNVSGNTFSGTLNWGFTFPSGNACTGTSTVTGTKM